MFNSLKCYSVLQNCTHTTASSASSPPWQTSPPPLSCAHLEMKRDGARPATWRPLCVLPSLLSPPHPSSSPHQDTLVLVNSGFKRNAALLWFSAGPVLKAGTYTVSQWPCGQGGGASNGLLYSHTFETSPAPASSPWAVLPSLSRDRPHAHPYHHESRLKNEKFLPLQAAKSVTFSRLLRAVTSPTPFLPLTHWCWACM